MPHDDVAGALEHAGFALADDLRAQLDGDAKTAGLRGTGPYELRGAWRNGDVVVVVERNTDAAGTHPPVATVEGPRGRAAVNLDDDDAAQVLRRACDAVTALPEGVGA